MDKELLEIYKKHFGGDPSPPELSFLNEVNEYIEILRRIPNGCD